jgi:membrane-associated phospholipid phosphatase
VHHPGTVHYLRRSCDGLAAAPLAGIAAGLFLALYLVFVGTPLGRALDASAVPSDLEGMRGDVVDRVVAAVNPLTVTLAVAILVLLAIRSGRPTDGIRAAAVVAVSALISGELEAVLAQVNPGAEAARELGPSFYPSGHAAVVMSLCLAGLLVAPGRSLFALTLAGVVLSSVLGFAIYAGGSHHPSDVVGGFLLALAAASIAAIGRPAWNSAALRDHRLPTTPIAVVLGAVASVPLVVEVVRRFSGPLDSLHSPLLLTGVVLSAAAFVIVLPFARLLGPR